MARPKHVTTNMDTLAEGVTDCARALAKVPLVMRPHVIEMLHKQVLLDLAIVREQIRQKQEHQAAAAVPEPEFAAELPIPEIPEIAAEVTPA